MFGNSNNDLAKTLDAMTQWSIDQCHHDQYAAKDKLAQTVAMDRRFERSA